MGIRNTNWKAVIDIKMYITDSEKPEDIVKNGEKIAIKLQKYCNKHENDCSYMIYDLIESFDMLDVTDINVLDEFNNLLTQLYDWADGERVWLGL